MSETPNPTPEAVALWLNSGLTRDVLHDSNWKEVNKRFHGITRAARPFILQHFKTPEEQQAAFDGLTLGLAAMARAEDITHLEALFTGYLTAGHIQKSADD